LLDRENDLQLEEEVEEGENGAGGGAVSAQRRRFSDGSQVPGSALTHKQVIASVTRRHMEEEKVGYSSLLRKSQIVMWFWSCF
jgi:hypothetical protein